MCTVFVCWGSLVSFRSGFVFVGRIFHPSFVLYYYQYIWFLIKRIYIAYVEASGASIPISVNIDKRKTNLLLYHTPVLSPGNGGWEGLFFIHTGSGDLGSDDVVRSLEHERNL